MFGAAVQTNEIPPNVQQEILAYLIEATTSGVMAYHVGGRGLQRYALKDRVEAFNKLTQIPGAIAGTSIAVRRGVPTDT